jgi:CHAD domain-containing protein
VEIEAKYAISDPSVFDTLLELRSVGSYTLRPTGERQVVDHYLDTEDRDLLKAGYACRLREGEADRPWRLTVKGLGKTEGAMHERPEFECDVPPHSRPPEWPECPAREIVLTASAGRPLAELFALRQLRSTRAVEQGERGVGELSLDTVDSEIAGHKSHARELEVELAEAGTPADLHAIDGELRRYDLEPQSTSKFERALAQLDGEKRVRKPRKKKKAVGVTADEPMAEAGRKILRFHFDRMVDNEEGTRKGEDIEALHDMRVATRRQRAALRIVSPHFKKKAAKPFRDELRALADRLGAVRDLDVLIEAAERHRASRRPEAAAALDPLLEEWRARRDDARHALLRHLDSGEYRDFIKRYDEFLSSPGAGVKGSGEDTPNPQLVRHVLPTEVWDHYARVRAYETVMSWASIETIHALRIEAKRLRYLLEFFQEVLGPGLSGTIDALVKIQDHIGELHDADVTIGLLRDFLMRSAQVSPNPAVAEEVGRYLKLTEARLRTLQRTLKGPWKRVAGPRLRATLARAVARL